MKRQYEEDANQDGSKVLKTSDLEEPLLTPNKDRFIIFPIQNECIWRSYKKHEASFWTAEEIDMSKDRAGFLTLNQDQQHFIKYVLAFFAASDGIVMENLALRFLPEVQIPEARFFYVFQAMMENIHSETYMKLLDTLVEDPDEKRTLFRAMFDIPCVQAKARWAIKWLQDESACFAQRLVAFAAVEGIFFSGSFCAIYWLKHIKGDIMHGLTFSNELIARDEGLHTEFACDRYRELLHPLEQVVVQNMIREAVVVEIQFVCESIPVDLLGMNSRQMSQYIEFVADRLLKSLGCESIFHAQNPFAWMEQISMEGKTNFFERRVGEYQKPNVMASLGNDNHLFSTEADF